MLPGLSGGDPDQVFEENEKRRHAVGALTSRSIGRIEHESLAIDAQGVCLSPILTNTSDGTGILTSDSTLMTAHHVVFPSRYEVSSPCSYRVTFGQLGDGSDADNANLVNHYRVYDPANLVNAQDLEDRTDNKCTNAGCDEEDPLLPNRLFQLGLERWATDREQPGVSEAVADAGYFRRATLRYEWPFMLDTRGAASGTVDNILDAFNYRGRIDHPTNGDRGAGRDIAYLAACDTVDRLIPYAPNGIFPNTYESEDTWSNDPTQPGYTPSGPLKSMDRPAVFFANVRVEEHDNGEFGPDPRTHVPAYNMMTANWPHGTGPTVPLVARPGSFSVANTNCGGDNSRSNVCIPFGRGVLAYPQPNHIQCSELRTDFIKGASGGSVLTSRFVTAQIRSLSLQTVAVNQGADVAPMRCESDDNCAGNHVCDGLGFCRIPCVQNTDCPGTASCTANFCDQLDAQESGSFWTTPAIDSGNETMAPPSSRDVAMATSLTSLWNGKPGAAGKNDLEWAGRDPGADPFAPLPDQPGSDGFPENFDCNHPDVCDQEICQENTGSGPLANNGNCPPTIPLSTGPSFTSNNIPDETFRPLPNGGPDPSDCPGDAQPTTGRHVCDFSALGDNRVDDGLVVGFWGSELSSGAGGIGNFHMICAPWSSTAYTNNWRFLYTWGRAIGRPNQCDGYLDTLPTGFAATGLLLTEFFRYVVEERTVPSPYWRPASAKLCPPNFYVGGLRFIRPEGAGAGEPYLGLHSLMCRRAPITADNPTFSGYPMELDVFLNDAEDPQDDRYAGLPTEKRPCGAACFDDFTLRQGDFDLSQRIGHPSATGDIIEWSCPDADDAIDGLTFASNPNGALTDVWIECAPMPR